MYNVSNTADNSKHVSGVKMHSTNLQKYDVNLFQKTVARFLLPQNRFPKNPFLNIFPSHWKIPPKTETQRVEQHCVHKKVIHTKTNLPLKAAGLCKYV